MQLRQLWGNVTARNPVSFAELPKIQTQVLSRKTCFLKCSSGYDGGTFDKAKLTKFFERVWKFFAQNRNLYFDSFSRKINFILTRWSGQSDSTCDNPAEVFFAVESFFSLVVQKNIILKNSRKVFQSFLCSLTKEVPPKFSEGSRKRFRWSSENKYEHMKFRKKLSYLSCFSWQVESLVDKTSESFLTKSPKIFAQNLYNFRETKTFTKTFVSPQYVVLDT